MKKIKNGKPKAGRVKQIKNQALIAGVQGSRLTADRVAGGLIGFGERVLSLAEMRLHVPTDVGHRIGDPLLTQWMAAIWMDECVRIMPRVLWPDYLTVMRAELGQTFPSRAFTVLIEQAATEITADRGGRWEFKKSFIEKAKLSEGINKDVVLVANRFWMEVWGRKTWEAVQCSLIQQTKHLGKVPQVIPVIAISSHLNPSSSDDQKTGL